MNESDSDMDPDPAGGNFNIRSQSAMPLGCNSVKALSSKFNGASSPKNGRHHIHGEDESQQPHKNGGHHPDLQQTVLEQQRIIENLQAQLTSKERRIQQLEDQIKMITMPMKSGMVVSSPTAESYA